MSPTRSFVFLAGLALAAASRASDPTPDSSRALAAELQADAASRAANLRGSGISLVDGADSSVLLGGFAQFRYYMNHREDPGAVSPPDSGFTNGFETARTRLNATGHVGTKDLTYKIEGEFIRGDGSFTLLDAYARYVLDNRTSIVWGQFQLPIIRDYFISPAKQLTVNNAIATEIFAPGYTQGVAVHWRGDHFAAMASLNDGLNASNSSFTSTAEADLAVTARAEYMWGRDWRRFEDFTSWRGDSNTWLLGGAIHWQTDGDTAASASKLQTERTLAAIDASFESNGWNLYASVIWAHLDPYSSLDFNDYGAILQGGYFLTDTIEGFARWDGVFVDSRRSARRDENLNTFTVGGNYYLFPHSHAAKFTADIQWSPSALGDNILVDGITSNNNLGIRASTKDNQFVLRFQFQVVF